MIRLIASCTQPILGFVTVLVSSFALHAPAQATETITYKYDAKGRVVKVERSGTVNNGASTQYSHDKANNRKNVTTTGA